MERYNKLHFAVRNNKLAEVKAILEDAAGKTMLVERTGANSEVCNKPVHGLSCNIFLVDETYLLTS